MQIAYDVTLNRAFYNSQTYIAAKDVLYSIRTSGKERWESILSMINEMQPLHVGSFNYWNLFRLG